MIMTVEVFKTNITCIDQAERLACLLIGHFPETRIDFDLEDCDRILRVEDKQICVDTIIEILGKHGLECEVLA